MNIVILARSSIKCFKYLELATGSGINKIYKIVNPAMTYACNNLMNDNVMKGHYLPHQMENIFKDRNYI